MLTRSAQLQPIEQEISRVWPLRLEFGIRDKLFNCALGEAPQNVKKKKELRSPYYVRRQRWRLRLFLFLYEISPRYSPPSLCLSLHIYDNPLYYHSYNCDLHVWRQKQHFHGKSLGRQRNISTTLLRSNPFYFLQKCFYCANIHFRNLPVFTFFFAWLNKYFWCQGGVVVLF